MSKNSLSLERNSGIETLRIVAMFMILLLHSIYYSFGIPDRELFCTRPMYSLFWFGAHAFGIIAVNVFVLASGWFGIRANFCRLAALLYQNFFFVLVLNCIGVAFLGQSLTLKMARNLFLLTDWNWFAKCYILLWVLSPVLNAYVKSVSRFAFRRFLLLFFAIQTLYGWLVPVAYGFNGGYSVLSFIGLYLLARYARIHQPRFSLNKRRFDAAVYISCSILLLCLGIVTVLFERPTLYMKTIQYNNPLVIVSALFFFLIFAKSSFSSRPINKIANSAYAVYLFHAHPSILMPVLVPTIKTCFPGNDATSGILSLLVVLTVVFAAAVVLDQLRQKTWMVAANRMCSHE